MIFDRSKSWQRWLGRATSMMAVVALLFTITACEAPEDMPDPDEMDEEMMMDEEPTMTIVDIAAGDERFETLVTALGATGLDETLAGPGPFTVFAPTNEAFDALPEGTLEELLQEENQDQLADILSYHVVSGEVTSADVADLESAATVQGEDIQINVDDEGNVTINDANVIEVDLMGDNGVIHVIDSVLLPPEE